MKTPYQTVWTPPAQMRDHNGVLLHPDTFFFASPPPEIGAVISASGVGITEELNRSRNTPLLSRLRNVFSSLRFSSFWDVILFIPNFVFTFAGFVFVFAVWSFQVIFLGAIVGTGLHAFGAGSVLSWIGGGLAAVLFAWKYDRSPKILITGD